MSHQSLSQVTSIFESLTFGPTSSMSLFFLSPIFHTSTRTHHTLFNSLLSSSLSSHSNPSPASMHFICLLDLALCNSTLSPCHCQTQTWLCKSKFSATSSGNGDDNNTVIISVPVDKVSNSTTFPFNYHSDSDSIWGVSQEQGQ